jgi:hypothetical protein
MELILGPLLCRDFVSNPSEGVKKLDFVSVSSQPRFNLD